MDAKATAMELVEFLVGNREIPYPPSFSQGFRVSGYSKAKPVNTALCAKLEFRGKCFASRPDACPRCGRCAARAAARRLADVRSVLAHSAANRQPARGRVQRR